MDKAAQFQDKVFREIYIPTLVQRYNEKVASVGLPPISTEAELVDALKMVELIESTKQAAAANRVNPLNEMVKRANYLEKKVTPPTNVNAVKNVAATTKLAEALKSLNS